MSFLLFFAPSCNGRRRRRRRRFFLGIQRRHLSPKRRLGGATTCGRRIGGSGFGVGRAGSRRVIHRADDSVNLIKKTKKKKKAR